MLDLRLWLVAMEIIRQKSKLPVVVAQLFLGALLIAVGLYNCTVNGIDPLWVSLIVLPVSIFLPHPQSPVLPPEETHDDVDVPDGPTPNTLQHHRQHRRQKLVFALHIFVCLTFAAVGICGLVLLDSRLRILWVALITFAVGCLVPTPFILLH